LRRGQPGCDTVDNQRNRGAKIAGVQVFGSVAGSVCHIRPKRVIFHLTEDRAPTFPSSGSQRLRYSRQDYPQFRFRLRPIVYKNPTKKFHYPRTLVLALQFRFSFALLILCPWSSLVAGLDFVLVVVQLHHRCVCFRRYPIHRHPDYKSCHYTTRLSLASRLV
jgi:hypothetical protein